MQAENHTYILYCMTSIKDVKEGMFVTVIYSIYIQYVRINLCIFFLITSYSSAADTDKQVPATEEVDWPESMIHFPKASTPLQLSSRI